MSHASPADLFGSIRRRYRLPEQIADIREMSGASHSAALAFALEQARLAVARGEAPHDKWKQAFITSLAGMIGEALDEHHGDPAFQTMVMRHRTPSLRAYGSLSAQSSADRRVVHTLVNKMAHPAKAQRLEPGDIRSGLERLHLAAAAERWSDLQGRADAMTRLPDIKADAALESALKDLLQHPALLRLMRLSELSADPLVQHYRSLWERLGPTAGSKAAIQQGSASQQRGADVEARVAEAVNALIQGVNRYAENDEAYRAVTSMRVPASIPGDPDRAKSEWDVVILKGSFADDAPDQTWDLCFLVEAKASVDAAITDFPRLQRGLRLLGKADADRLYRFQTQQGAFSIRGASLSRVGNSDDLAAVVLYCCDSGGDSPTRVLSPASRMQLLSAPEALQFASEFSVPDPRAIKSLEPLWFQVLSAAKWRGLLHQYPTLRQVRELMVHTNDLMYAHALG
jgi:hypothetical protein